VSLGGEGDGKTHGVAVRRWVEQWDRSGECTGRGLRGG
jgi:hypothetical protein